MTVNTRIKVNALSAWTVEYEIKKKDITIAQPHVNKNLASIKEKCFTII